MTADEQAIRELIATWHRATAENDHGRVLTLMADDVVFLVPGHQPIRGRQQFAALQGAMPAGMRFESSFDIAEIQIHGDWAHLWAHLSVMMTPPGGEPVRRSGYTLTLFRKEADGRWVLARDANLLVANPD